jgi:tape measure domain-containing protein
MTTSVENKVVSLTFDNTSFQKRVGDTLSTLEKLKQSLNFSKSANSMNELQGAANKFNMGPMASAIEGVSAKFAALATIGITALANITNRAIDAGFSLAKSLSLKPIMDGFSEYETNMNSIQTILSNTKSKGTTLDQVTASLDKLNEYSDKTIYNFGEMARNIGTFTAAGVDLDTSVMSIKGIANIAAMSGSNAEQAATGMYQLSQAISTGTVRLQDWISVEKAGFGGEAFQTQLFETAKAMGTLKNVPMGQTFEQWKDAGNSFRYSLEQGWLTADVLTTTLGGLSGDLDASSLAAKGFSDSQIAAIQDMAKTATAAATEVKTATQLVGTIKEAIGTGWSTTFKMIIGDFGEAKGLFSGLYSYIGGAVDRWSDARNTLLQGWKAFGGRNELMSALMNTLAAISSILTPIKDAFRTVFPPMTAETLIKMTTSLKEFTQKLILSADTAAKVKAVFTGVFSIFKIGVEIVKGIFSVFSNLAGIIFGFGGNALAAGAGVGNFISKLREMLVEGGGIKKFFDFINSGVQKLGDIIQTAKDKIAGLFGGGSGEAIPGAEESESLLSKIIDKLSGLSVIGEKAKSAISAVGDGFKAFFNGVKAVLTGIWDAISTFFSTIGSKVAGVFSADAFDPALKVIQVGLLGGITGLLAAFFKKGLKLDFGQFDFLEKISGLFEEFGNTLKAFQLKVKADALLRIAAAVAVLTASVLVLSFIDAKKIAASLGALAVGFGQLVASMALLAKIETNPAKMMGLAASMILLAGAAAVLSVSLWMMSRLSLGEIAKGLLGVLGAIQILTMALQFFAKNNASFLRSAFSLIVLGASIGVLAGVIFLFSKIDLKDLAHGLVGVGASLGLFAAAVHFMGGSDVGKVGLSFLLFSFGLRGVHKAIQAFSDMTWDEMIRGLTGLGFTLAGIAAFTYVLNDLDLLKVAAGLGVMAVSLWIIAKAIETVGKLSFSDMVSGLIGVGATLLMLVLAVNAIQGAALGVMGVIAVAGAVIILAKALEIVGNLGLGTILVGLLGIAGVLLILGAAAVALAAFPPVLGALQAMGIALMVIGAGFALLGVGAFLVAKALVELGSAGEKSIQSLVKVLNTIIAAVPGFVKAFAEGIISLVKVLLDAAPEIINSFQGILEKILDMVIKIMPKVGEVFSSLIDTAAAILIEKSPVMVQAGLTLLLNFMQGIRDNIYQITQLGVEILTGFIQSLADNVGLLMAAASNLMVSFLQGLMAHALNMVQAGIDLLTQFLNGIALNIGQVIQAGANILAAIITGLGNAAIYLVNTATDLLVKFLGAFSNNATEVITAVANLIKTLIEEIGNKAGDIITCAKDTAIKFLDGLVDNAIDFTDKAGELIRKLLDGLTAAIDKHSEEIGKAGLKLAGAIINGVTGGIAKKAGGLFTSVKDLAGGAIGAFKDKILSRSPSKVFYAIGKTIPQGLVLALDRDRSLRIASSRLAENATDSFSKALDSVDYGSLSSDAFSPKIRPVLDLTLVNKEARGISNLFGNVKMEADLSLNKARSLSTSINTQKDPAVEDSVNPMQPALTFQQNIYSPRALSAEDIYRNTRNQISLAKEELRVP